MVSAEHTCRGVECDLRIVANRNESTGAQSFLLRRIRDVLTFPQIRAICEQKCGRQVNDFILVNWDIVYFTRDTTLKHQFHVVQTGQDLADGKSGLGWIGLPQAQWPAAPAILEICRIAVSLCGSSKALLRSLQVT